MPLFNDPPPNIITIVQSFFSKLCNNFPRILVTNGSQIKVSHPDTLCSGSINLAISSGNFPNSLYLIELNHRCVPIKLYKLQDKIYTNLSERTLPSFPHNQGCRHRSAFRHFSAARPTRMSEPIVYSHHTPN